MRKNQALPKVILCLKVKPPLEISHRISKGWLVPQNPSGQGSRRVGLLPLLPLTRVPPYIALLPCSILVFGIVGHSSRTETHNLLFTVFLKYGVEFLLGAMRLPYRFKPERLGHLLYLAGKKCGHFRQNRRRLLWINLCSKIHPIRRIIPIHRPVFIFLLF